jgi:hypothetical protein
MSSIRKEDAQEVVDHFETLPGGWGPVIRKVLSSPLPQVARQAMPLQSGARHAPQRDSGTCWLVADEGMDRTVVQRLRQDGHDVAYVAECLA